MLKKMLMSALLAVLLLFPLFLSLKLRAKEQGSNGISVRITLLGITLYLGAAELRLKNGFIPQIFEVKNKKERLIYTPGMKRKKGSIFFRAAKRAFTVEKFDLLFSTGTGNAAVSALLCGILNSAADIFAHALSARIKSARVCIRPDFEKTGVEFKLDCIIVFRIADIIKKVFSLTERR